MKYLDEPIDVLLVEDNPGDVRLTREAFETTEIETNIHAVTNGHDAMDFLRRQGEYESASRPDLVLLDLNLPGKGGCEILKEIRDDRRLRRLPVVIFTSSKAPEDVTECYDSHANAYLTKPTDPGEFISLVEEVERFWIKQARLPPHPR